MFGKLFGKKKKEERKSSMDLTIRDLKQGDFVDYFMTSWQVKEVNIFDWGNDEFSKEFLLDNGSEQRFLSYGAENDEEFTLSKRITNVEFNLNVKQHFRDRSDAPESLEYKNVNYRLSEESQGHFVEEGKENEDEAWVPFVNFDYFASKQEDTFVSVVQLGEQRFETYSGSVVKEYEFSNIVPAE